MFQQRRSDPNIKFSSRYPSGINIRSGSLGTNTRQPAYPAEISGYKTCKASTAAGSEIVNQCETFEYSLESGERYSPGVDVDRKTQLAETELHTRMESRCLSVTEHALGLDK